MNLLVNGVEYTNFVSAECEIRLDALTNSFRFEAVAPQGNPLPFKGGDSCEVRIDNETVLTGFIEIINVTYDGEDHIITVSGRDKTADLLDSSLDDESDIRGEGLTLKELIEKVIENLGLDILVIDQANPEPYNGAEDIAAPEPGENAFKFLEKYSRKRQVLLTSNGDGNVVIAKNSGIQAEGAVQHIIDSAGNNVLTSSFTYDITGRYNAYKISSGLNPIALNLSGDTNLATLVNQSGRVFDEEIRSGRRIVLISESPFSDTNCENRAKWEADIRKARGLIYSALVPGYRVSVDSGDLWQVNRLYQIVDDFVGKTENMLCNSVTYSIRLDRGANTFLSFVGENAYTLLLEDDPKARVADNVA